MEKENYFSNIENILKSIPSDYLKAEKKVFTFDKVYRVFRRKESNPHLSKIYGASFMWRLIRNWKRLRKKNPYPSKIELSLPDDAIIMARPEKKGIIAISYDKNLCIKAFLDSNFEHMLEFEMDVLASERGNTYFPQIIAASKGDQGNWCLTDVSINTYPFFNRINPERYILDHFNEIVLKRLGQFYKKNIQLKETLKEWCERSIKRADNHPSQELILKTLKRIKEYGSEDESKIFITGKTHFDLHAGNILNDGKEIKIIDWEGGRNCLVLVDFFYVVKKYVQNNFFQRRKLFNYLSSRETSPPDYLLRVISYYKEWLGIDLSLYIDPRVFCLVSLVDQALILYEDEKLDILSDERAIERKILYLE